MNFQHLLFPCLGRLPAGRVFLAAALSAYGVQAYAASADVTAVADVTDVQGDTAASSALPEVIVTGNPLGAAQTIAPASVLSGDNLLLQRASTLGATLQALPGVASSDFGPNAGRPTIRGLDGDRVRILQNGSASFDASALSYDHNTPLDPLVAERVEVLRGPAALLYGGSAQGGVVNVRDNRIPKTPVVGVTGRADASYSSGSREKAGAAMLEAGNGQYALHVDAFHRQSADVAVPVELPCTRPGAAAQARRICNSGNRAHGGAVGGTVFFDQGYLGASLADYHSSYGTVAEDEVRIGMRSSKAAIEGLWNRAGHALEQIKLQYSQGDYQHTEYEGDAAGTVFGNQGQELRLEAKHRPWGKVHGVWGLQWEKNDFSALGDEAFVPASRSQSLALFAQEELRTDWGKWTLGTRLEQVRVRSLGGNVPGQFFTGEKRFTPSSSALGVLIQASPHWQISSNLSYTQRAPKDYELFADGPHVATATWERGDANQRLEKSLSLDVGAQWQAGAHRFSLSAFASRYGNYIALLPTGAIIAPDNLPEYAFTGVKARFVGLEADGSLRLLGAGGWWQPQVAGAGALDLDLRGDWVRATNTSLGQALPLIAPARLGATLRWTQGAWAARLGFDSYAGQNRVPAGARSMAGYTLWNASLTWRQDWGASQLKWYAQLDNLSDRLAYSATSILSQTAPGKSPLPGRSLRLGVQMDF